MIEGKFKIMNQKWNEELSNDCSDIYRKLSITIENAIEETLGNYKTIGNKSGLKVRDDHFTAGSVVCHFTVGHKQELIVQDIFQALKKISTLKRETFFKKFKIVDS